MSDETFDHAQFFQQAIDTTITCRSIIKYNSTLNEQQKAEILEGIDSTLTFLKARLAANATLKENAVLSRQKLANFLSVDASDASEEDEPPFVESLSGDEQAQEDLPLKNLYRIYHSYLDNERITDLETRYKTVMGVLEQLEQVSSSQHDLTAGDLTAARTLHRIRGFVTAIYYMFREFAVVFSNIVDGKNIDMDTEALTPLDKYSSEERPQQMLRDITPLMRIYAAHRRIQERRGSLTKRAADAIAFLIFLEESLEPAFARRNEIIAHLKTIAGLLTDLTRLLVEYEQVMSTFTEA